MENNVYVVTSGQYSDYRISGIFTTRELAEAFISAIDDRYNEINDIEVWPLNPFEAEISKGFRFYEVRMEMRTGNVAEIRGLDSMSARLASSHVYVKPSTMDKTMWVHACARDEAHAVKIAADLRRDYIISKELL